MVCIMHFVLLLVLTVEGSVGQRISDIRLYPSSSSNGGRLELFTSYGWTPISINVFDMFHADLACRVLGFQVASGYATVGHFGYTQATTDYSVSSLSCVTWASDFSGCSHSVTYSLGYHSSDVGLQCSNSSKALLRLVSTSGESYGVSSGRLEIFINGTWGTMCDYLFSSITAALACNDLGFDDHSDFRNASISNGYTVTDSTPIWFKDYSCGFHSPNLRLCGSLFSTVSDCSHGNDIILTCSEARIHSGELRLISSDSSSKTVSAGRLEICYNESTTGSRCSPFCTNFFSYNDAYLACKSLGFLKSYGYGRVADYGFDESSAEFGIVVYCGSKTNFSSCSKSTTTMCPRSHDVGLNCTNNESATPSPKVPPPLIIDSSSDSSSGSLRLVSGTSRSGRLEVYYYQSSGYQWTTFCYSSFSSRAADLACVQLGYTGASNYGRVGSLGYEQGSGSQSITYISCSSYDTTLKSCTISGSSSCSHYNDVAVNCTGVNRFSTSTSGLIVVAIIVTVVIFVCSALCVGGVICAVMIAVVCRNKRMKSPRTTVIQSQNASENRAYHSSGRVAYNAANVSQPVSLVHYAPSPPATMAPHNVPPQVNAVSKPEDQNAEKFQESADNLCTSEDDQPLIP